MGSGHRRGQRGNSHLIGAVLLIGIVMTGALVVLLGGQAIIDDTQSQGESDLAGQTFRQMDGLFESGSNNSEVDVPDGLEGDLTVNESSSWRLRLNDNPKCVSGHRGLGSMEYTDDEDRLVGYEGGGIWKKSDSGATMDSPPDLTYRNGSLSLAFPNVTGSVSSTHSVSASSNVSRSAMQGRNLSRGLYTRYGYDSADTIGDGDVICPPSNVNRGTLWINDSQFAGAWANYFEDNYDDKRVRVKTSNPVPGESVKVAFMLGDVSDPQYNVTNLDVRRSGTDIVVDATVENRGGLAGEAAHGLARDVILTKDGSEEGRESDLELKSGESDTLTYSIPESKFSTGTTYDLKVDTEDNSSTVPVEFNGGPSNLQIANVDVPQNASKNADEQATVKLRNDGDMTAVQTVEFYIDNGSGSSLVGSEDVVVQPGATKPDVEFDLPTDTTGRLDWEVETEDATEASKYVVGAQPYFANQDVDSPSQVSAYDGYEIEATIRNTKDMRGEMPVSIRIVNVSRDNNVTKHSETLTIDGTAYPGAPHEETISLSHTFTSSDEGRYRYVVETPNETTSGTFTVGPAINPNFAIESVDASQNPTYYGERVYFDVTVRNRGATPGSQQVQLVHENGNSLWTDTLYLEPGEQATLNKSFVPTKNQFEQDWTRLTVQTVNASDDLSLAVVEKDSYDEEDGKLVFNKGVEAEVTVLGAELEGKGIGRVINDPIQMDLRVENDSGVHLTELWRDRVNDGDINDPRAEQTMVRDVDPYNPRYNRSNPYKYSVDLEENSSLSVFAQSRSCRDYDPTDVEWKDVDTSGHGTEDLVGEECSDPGDVNIRISDDSNTENVVILQDGDSVPSYDTAASYQRSLQDMLGSRIRSNGTLSLADGESVFLYELSKRNADPDNADGPDDPDYNDAVVLFRVVSTEETVTPPADIDVEDIDAPSSLPASSGGDVGVEVNNSGGQIGSSKILWNIEGTDVHQSAATGNLEPGERETLHFDIPSDLDPGTYRYTVNVGSDPEEEHIGSFTVGSPPDSMLQITSMTAPTVVEDDHAEEAEVFVENTGQKKGDQTVRLVADGGTVDAEPVSLKPGKSETVNLKLPTRSPSGHVTYEVKTQDSSSGERKLYVGESIVDVEAVQVGATNYEESDLVERRQLEKLTVELNNTGTVGGQRTVTLNVEDGDGNTFSADKTVKLGNGRIGTYPVWETFDVEDPASGDQGLSNGYYDYTVTVEDDGTTTQTWSGKMFVQENADVGNSQNSSSPIGIDSNEVVISG